jgi:hypothetical protein
MSTPSRDDVDSMKNLMSIINGGMINESITEPTYAPQQEQRIAPTVVTGDPGVSSMKEILSRFYESTQNSVERVVTEKAEQSPLLKEALNTRLTESGVRVGSWEITVHEDAPGQKTYDVTNVHTNEPIAHDLSLYESALGLTKLLNRNVGINNSRVREILELEEEFTRHRTDAAVFKRKMNRMLSEGDGFRANVAEDRYEECKRQAIELRSRLISICKSI